MAQDIRLKRDPIIDIMKGMAIFCVIVGHSWGHAGKGEEFVSQFHMALFMAISGFLFKETKVEDIKKLKDYILRKVRTLYLPYVLANSVFILLNNFFVRIHFFCTDSKLVESFQPEAGADCILSFGETVRQILLCFVFLGYSPRFGGATWFLRCLFIIAVFHGIVALVFCKFKIHRNWSIVIAIFFICIKIVNDRYSLIRIGTIDEFFMYYYAYVFGWLFSKIKTDTKLPSVTWLALSLVLFAVLIYKFDHVGLIRSITFMPAEFLSAINMIVCFLMGWFMAYGFAKVISGFRLSNLLIWCGESTLEIMLLHFLMFKFVTVLYVYIHHLPGYYLAATPIIKEPGVIFGSLYMIAGMMLPTIIHFVLCRTKAKSRR